MKRHLGISERASYAASGIAFTWRTEGGFRFHALLSGVELLLLLIFDVPILNVLLVLLCAGTVLAFELSNTAIENLLDHLHPEQHDSVKVAKDCAAGAVFLMSLVAGAITLVSLLLY